jgi:hypothetical protein
MRRRGGRLPSKCVHSKQLVTGGQWNLIHTCAVGSSLSSKSTNVLPGPTQSDAFASVRSAQGPNFAAITIALMTVLGFILLTIAAFFLWRHRRGVQRRSPQAQLSVSVIEPEMRMRPPILTLGTGRLDPDIEEPPAVPAREAQDPPRPASEAPPPPYDSESRILILHK